MTSSPENNIKNSAKPSAVDTFPSGPDLFPVPSDHRLVYPVSAFPPLEWFEVSTEYHALLIPVRRTAELRNTLRGLLLRRSRLKNVYPSIDVDGKEGADQRVLVLKEPVNNNGPTIWKDERLIALLQDDTTTCSRTTYTVTLQYDDWTVEQVLRRILPATILEIPSAFEIIGHIAHFNLRSECLPYQYLIGKVVLDKHPNRIRTVVNKTGQIDTVFRTFDMRVIAGNENANWSEVTVHESKCQFALDFRNVYWNSRLSSEHERMVQMIKQDAAQRTSPTIVADLMAGVGPFAVPLTTTNNNGNNKNNKVNHKKHGNKKNGNTTTPSNNIVVHANDLNPTCYHYLQQNAKANHCLNLFCYNMDARTFAHYLLHEQPIPVVHHVIMNLPAAAPEFLNAFCGTRSEQMPRIHVYCFAPKPAPETPTTPARTQPDVELEVIERCRTALGVDRIDPWEHRLQIRIVRDVSPTKNMLSVSFDLPKAVANVPRIVLQEDHNQDSESNGGETCPKGFRESEQMPLAKQQVGDGVTGSPASAMNNGSTHDEPGAKRQKVSGGNDDQDASRNG